MKSKLPSIYPLLAIATALTIAGCSSSDDDSAGDNDIGNSSVALFDESTDGDITDDPNNPQPFQLVDGANSITGSVISGDIDYVTVNVPGGSELSAINLTSYESVDDQSFIGIQAGTVFTELPDNPQQGNLLGFVLFGTAFVGTDILPNIGTGEGTQGFTPPLSDGDYTFWIQETGTDAANYSFDFVVSPVSP